MKIKIGIIGLGYVGLPLACLFSKKYSVVGYDISQKRIDELILGIDSTLEVDTKTLKNLLIKNYNDNQKGLFITKDEKYLKKCNYYIITVPTPIRKNKSPDLKPLFSATKLVAKYLNKKDIVIYESTVYPGLTEEECVPVLQKISNLFFNKDFFVGYSPERINPGDKKHTVDKILKITSGSSPSAAKKVDNLYKSVIKAGTYLAPSIKVAEAAKVIENSQRDINIAFVNELAKIFNLLDINTNEVLKAAGTKWNFLPFKPGLVGGHCIGVDPYYLAKKAEEVGYNPEIILTGRRLNDSMGKYVVSQLIDAFAKNALLVKNAKILILGFTFKENCPDIRNTKIIDIVEGLKSYGAKISIYDPWADSNEIQKQFSLRVIDKISKIKFDAIVFCVSHKGFNKINLKSISHNKTIIYDLKNVIGNKANLTL